MAIICFSQIAFSKAWKYDIIYRRTFQMNNLICSTVVHHVVIYIYTEKIGDNTNTYTEKKWKGYKRIMPPI
jgi:hypothetical protein